MLLRSFVIFVFLISFFTARVFFSHHRLTYLICSSLLVIAPVLLGWEYSKSNGDNLAQEDHPCKAERRTLGKTDSKDAFVLQASLTVPSPTSYTGVNSSKLHNAEASDRKQIPSRTFRRSFSYTVPRSEHCGVGLLRSDDNQRDQSISRLLERSAIDFVSLLSAKGNIGAANLERVPSLTAEEVNQLADAFIAHFHEHMIVEKQDSINGRAEETMTRQKSYERYKAMLERSAG